MPDAIGSFVDELVQRVPDLSAPLVSSLSSYGVGQVVEHWAHSPYGSLGMGIAAVGVGFSATIGTKRILERRPTGEERELAEREAERDAKLKAEWGEALAKRELEVKLEREADLAKLEARLEASNAERQGRLEAEIAALRAGQVTTYQALDRLGASEQMSREEIDQIKASLRTAPDDLSWTPESRVQDQAQVARAQEREEFRAPGREDGPRAQEQEESRAQEREEFRAPGREQGSRPQEEEEIRAREQEAVPPAQDQDKLRAQGRGDGPRAPEQEESPAQEQEESRAQESEESRAQGQEDTSRVQTQEESPAQEQTGFHAQGQEERSRPQEQGELRAQGQGEASRVQEHEELPARGQKASRTQEQDESRGQGRRDPQGWAPRPENTDGRRLQETQDQAQSEMDAQQRPRSREELELRKDQALRRLQQLARSDDTEGWDQAMSEYNQARAEEQQLSRGRDLDQEQGQQQSPAEERGGRDLESSQPDLERRSLEEAQEQALREMQRTALSRGPGDENRDWDAANRAYQQARQREIELLRRQGRLAPPYNQDQGRQR
ncbi:MAG: hypothetical protein J2P38_00025 [Candidatus Dormibacteraeota bacterium]|nr:hypothetical protein [Candidatus Dormibacteraeota bacterium]